MQTFKQSVALLDASHPGLELRLSANDADRAVVIALPIPAVHTPKLAPVAADASAASADEYARRLRRHLMPFPITPSRVASQRPGAGVSTMKLRFHAAAALFSLVGVTAARADSAPASAVTGNVAVTTDYMFRGLTQTWGRPAIQGGADYASPDGFAAGFWGSSISERSYPGGAMELDLYANYGQSINSDWSWRAGLYGYVYPGANLEQAGLASRSLNTLEANAALTWKQVTLKYNRALTDYFGVDTEQGYTGDSKGTDYLQLDVTIPLNDTWSLAFHAGHTHYTTTLAAPLANGARNPGYSDLGGTLKVQLNRHWSLSGGVTCASDADFYRRTSSFLNASDTRNVGGTRGFTMLQGTF